MAVLHVYLHGYRWIPFGLSIALLTEIILWHFNIYILPVRYKERELTKDTMTIYHGWWWLGRPWRVKEVKSGRQKEKRTKK